MPWFCFKGIPDLPAPLRKQLIATRDGAGNSRAFPVVVFPSSPLDQQRTARAAPVSQQKRPRQNATNAIEIKRKHSKINEPDRCSAAHSGRVAASSPAGPTSKSGVYSVSFGITAPETPRFV
jgi:hypothetical protein